jgi:hypothetical protein
MGLFDGYFDPDQFQDSGGLLGRLLSLQREQGQYQSPAFVLQATGSAAPWPDLLNYGQLPTARDGVTQEQPAQYAENVAASKPYSPILNPSQSNIQNVGITSDQSIYCKTMKNLCHNQCVGLALAPDGFGPYRACMRPCMHNAGCFDF